MRGTTIGNVGITVATLSILTTLSIFAWAQARPAPIARQSFDVASVRPSGPGQSAFNTRRVRVLPGGRFVATGAPLEELIRFAYALESYQAVDGGPSSLLKQRFDVNATSDAADVPDTQPGVIRPMNTMVQTLLAERFRLRVRWEEPEQSVLVLVRARPDGTLGPGLRSSTVDCADPESRKAQATLDPRDCGINRINGRIQAAGHRMSAFAGFLSRLLQRPVFDRTNLEGTFVIDMTSNSDGIPPIAGPLTPGRVDETSPSSGPALATAIKEQLGLSLESRREPVPVLVVEHVEPPTPN